ncbi:MULTISPECIES: hypothetical protein [Natrialbaceae]|uniref:hypothetical protein n=1 Tax=Natrialbaceae TaxID=1644061 RepID=UPI00207D63E8|nr:hypothetical protein [Natronococcus sp. CG52]
MSTQPHHSQPEPTQKQPTTGPNPAATSEKPTESPTERAPATFSRGRTDRLENLVDEWNAGFAASAE